MMQEFEQTQAVVRSSISKVSTILDEEHWLELTEDDLSLFSGRWTKLIKN